MMKRSAKIDIIGLVLAIGVSFNIPVCIHAMDTSESSQKTDDRVTTETIEFSEEGIKEDINSMHNGWEGTLEEGNLCYYDENGEKVKGLQIIDEITYYFDEDGILQTGWQIVEGIKYYFLPDTGVRYENRIEIIDGVSYSFDGSVKQFMKTEPEKIGSNEP